MSASDSCGVRAGGIVVKRQRENSAKSVDFVTQFGTLNTLLATKFLKKVSSLFHAYEPVTGERNYHAALPPPSALT